MDDTDSDSSMSLHTIQNSDIEDPNSNFNRAFNYIDWDSCSNIMKAVLLDDINAVQQILLKKQNAINSRDQLYNTPLHMAYVQQNMEVLNMLLTHPDVNLESKNYEGETALMKSIGKTSDAVVIRLLDAGCDINTQDSVGRNPLHIALNFQRTIVEELLKRGADLNIACGCGGPPLFHAINISSIELLCMLLYYNADTSITNDANMTPFLYSLDSQFDRSLAYELLPYVDDFRPTDASGLNCLSLAANNLHPIVMDILQVIDYKSLNQIDFYGNSALYYSLFYSNGILFKELFSKMDHKILLKSDIPFLEPTFANILVGHSNWHECFYLLASSDIFPKLMAAYMIHLDRTPEGLFSTLLNEFSFEDISQNDREKIIYILLSYGAKVLYQDIINYYNIFGPSNEINILLSFKIDDNLPLNYSPFLSYIFGQEVRKSYSDLKRDIIEEINQADSRSIVNILRFFTFSFTNMQELIQNENIHLLDIDLGKCHVPSLLELCRNEVRFKVRNDGITTTNEFYEAVEKLIIPVKIKKFILFKTPLR